MSWGTSCPNIRLPSDGPYGIGAFLLVEDHFDHFGFPIEAPVEQAANAKTIQLLNGSPYKDQLGNSVQFLQMLGTQTQSIPTLISPHLISEMPLANLLLTVAHSTPGSKEQSISALPMGSRIGLNPWTSHVDLQKSKPRALVSSQKRQPLLINPSIPHLVLQSTEGPEQQGKIGTNRLKSARELKWRETVLWVRIKTPEISRPRRCGNRYSCGFFHGRKNIE
jgi:hypothetical protein